MSHASGEEEPAAGSLGSFGDLTEVNTNVVLEHLLENLGVSQDLCLSHSDLGCPVNPALPLQIQHNTSYHASRDTCLFDLAVPSSPSSLRFLQRVSRTVCSIILFSARKHRVPLHTFVKCAPQPAHACTVRVQPGASAQVTASPGPSSVCTQDVQNHAQTPAFLLHTRPCVSSAVGASA